MADSGWCCFRVAVSCGGGGGGIDCLLPTSGPPADAPFAMPDGRCWYWAKCSRLGGTGGGGGGGRGGGSLPTDCGVASAMCI